MLHAESNVFKSPTVHNEGSLTHARCRPACWVLERRGRCGHQGRIFHISNTLDSETFAYNCFGKTSKKTPTMTFLCLQLYSFVKRKQEVPPQQRLLRAADLFCIRAIRELAVIESKVINGLRQKKRMIYASSEHVALKVLMSTWPIFACRRSLQLPVLNINEDVDYKHIVTRLLASPSVSTFWSKLNHTFNFKLSTPSSFISLSRFLFLVHRTHGGNREHRSAECFHPRQQKKPKKSPRCNWHDKGTHFPVMSKFVFNWWLPGSRA